jgi:hypothetical protein
VVETPVILQCSPALQTANAASEKSAPSQQVGLFLDAIDSPPLPCPSMPSQVCYLPYSLCLWGSANLIAHETRNDYGKRRLLRTAIANLPASEIGERTELVAEITWILDAADKLEGLRDDSVHTPVHYTFPISFL